jgi:hypothetical protein
MAKRAMTIKGFVNKATSTNLTAAGFLSQYREYLSTGEVANLASPILAQIDGGQLTAEVGLEQITGAVFAHMLNASVLAAEAKLAADNSDEPTPSNKNYITKLFAGNGAELKSEEFNLPQDAERAGERWLLNSTTDCYVQVESLKLKTKSGQPFITTITREDAFANQYRTKKGAVTKGKPVSSGKLGFGVRVKQDHCHFSHG